MPRLEHIWREQCGAAKNIKTRYGEQAALDYLVGEKLLHFVSAAKTHPDFASQLPAFLVEVRQLFSGAALSSYLKALEERLIESAHHVDEFDIEFIGTNTGDLESLLHISDLLRAPTLGTA